MLMLLLQRTKLNVKDRQHACTGGYFMHWLPYEWFFDIWTFNIWGWYFYGCNTYREVETLFFCMKNQSISRSISQSSTITIFIVLTLPFYIVLMDSNAILNGFHSWWCHVLYPYILLQQFTRPTSKGVWQYDVFKKVTKLGKFKIVSTFANDGYTRDFPQKIQKSSLTCSFKGK